MNSTSPNNQASEDEELDHMLNEFSKASSTSDNQASEDEIEDLIHSTDLQHDPRCAHPLEDCICSTKNNCKELVAAIQSKLHAAYEAGRVATWKKILGDDFISGEILDDWIEVPVEWIKKQLTTEQKKGEERE